MPTQSRRHGTRRMHFRVALSRLNRRATQRWKPYAPANPNGVKENSLGRLAPGSVEIMVGQALKDRRKVENSRKRATQPGTPLAPARERGFILKCGGTTVVIASVPGQRKPIVEGWRVPWLDLGVVPPVRLRSRKR